MGLDCEGNETEMEACNVDICPSCPRLHRKYGTIVTCIDNLSEYDMECNMTCEKGKVLTNGQRPYEKYKCGPKTGYMWEPTDKMPACVETAAMTELLDTFRSKDEITEFIQTNSTSIFDVSVGGVEYTIDSSSISFVGTVTCADGYAGADGLCAQCATGTKLNFPDCVSCEIGTYQPHEGQSECLPCPDGYTTSTFGASDISECAVIVQSYSSTVSTVTGKDDKNGNNEDDKTTVLVVALVVCVIVICTIAVVAFVFWKKHARRRFARNETAGSFISLSMMLPETRVTVENAKSSFNKELLVPAQAKSSYENTIYGTS